MTSSDMTNTPSMPSARPLAGCHALVTGGSAGIGAGIARALFGAGAQVGIVARRPPETWARPMPPDWPRRSWIEADLNDAQASSAALHRYLEAAPPPDILVHSAVSYGVGGRKGFGGIGTDEWQQMFAVNVHAPFVLTRELLPSLLARPRSLVLYVSSEVVFNAGPGRAAYAATKAALHSTMTSLAQETVDAGLSVVGVLPETMVDTPGIRRRRAADFDYTGYASPDDFARPLVPLVAGFGEGCHGRSLVVTADGGLVPVDRLAVPSQSRPLAPAGSAA